MRNGQNRRTSGQGGQEGRQSEADAGDDDDRLVTRFWDSEQGGAEAYEDRDMRMDDLMWLTSHSTAIPYSGETGKTGVKSRL